MCCPADTARTAKCDVSQLCNESRLYKIIVLKHKLLDALIYSTVEYTIEYMYKIIALRSDFCDLDVVIFQNTVSGYAGPYGQNHRKG